MDREASISQGIRIADEKARYDAACKRLLSEKRILAWIMKSCLEEYRDCTIEDIAERYIEGQPQIGEVPVAADESGDLIRGADTKDSSLNEGTVTYDIRFYAIVPGTNDRIRLIINLEAQNDYYPGYPILKRAVFYCCRMISSQYGREFTGPQYGKLKKVYSIWICMNPPKNRENTITRYRMTEEALAGQVQEAAENYDLLSVVVLCLGDPEKGDGVLKMLDMLFSNAHPAEEKRRVLEQEFSIAMTQEMIGEVSSMCNLSEGVERRGIAKGIAKGKEQGHTEATLAYIKNLTETMGLSVQQAMVAMKVPEEEQTKYADLLAQT